MGFLMVEMKRTHEHGRAHRRTRGGGVQRERDTEERGGGGGVEHCCNCRGALTT